MSRARFVVIASVATLLLGGCTQAINGSPTSTFPTNAADLADRIAAGAASLHTAHLTLRETVGGQTLSARGDEVLSAGKSTALSLVEQLPSFGTIRVVRTGGKTFVRLPPAQRNSDKPWALVRPGSSNPIVSAMADALSSTDQLAGLHAVSVLVRAIDSLRFIGIERFAGVTVGHYELTIDVARLPEDFPQKKTLETVGLTSIPLDLWIDEDGRGRKATESMTAVGQHILVEITLGAFDLPVHISAPPASQVDNS